MKTLAELQKEHPFYWTKTSEYKALVNKVFEVMVWAKTLSQIGVAIRYIDLMENYMTKKAWCLHDKFVITHFAGFRRGFMMGLSLQKETSMFRESENSYETLGV